MNPILYNNFIGPISVKEWEFFGGILLLIFAIGILAMTVDFFMSFRKKK